jgi:hypothetical protein
VADDEDYDSDEEDYEPEDYDYGHGRREEPSTSDPWNVDRKIEVLGLICSLGLIALIIAVVWMDYKWHIDVGWLVVWYVALGFSLVLGLFLLGAKLLKLLRMKMPSL